MSSMALLLKRPESLKASGPLRYPEFLEESAGRLLLFRIGGGYILIHLLLQDYFVTLKALRLRLRSGCGVIALTL
jgi:hypothetical protein